MGGFGRGKMMEVQNSYEIIDHGDIMYSTMTIIINIILYTLMLFREEILKILITSKKYL